MPGIIAEPINAVNLEKRDRMEEDLAHMEQIRKAVRLYRKNWTLSETLQIHDEFYDLVFLYPHQIEDDEELLQELWDQYERLEKRAIEHGKSECPIAFFEPSWEQAQMMNAWHPDYEPENNSGEGYSVFGNMGTVRGGKTWGVVANTILWLVPNDPDWPIFRKRKDFLGREIQVLPRFHWDTWRQTGRRIFPEAKEPPKDACEIWQGVPDEFHWYQKVEKVYRKFMPTKYIGKAADGSLQWYRSEKLFRTVFGHTVTAKLYGSDMQAWSGEEVWLTNLDEGPPRDKLDEVVYRSRYINWSYTPREARNIGERSKLAFDCYKGKYKLRGHRKFIFPKMSEIAPHILSEEDKQERIAIGEAHGAAGKAAIEGGFFESSPVVFSNFTEANILPITGKELLKLYPDANLIRALDEGTAHPTAVVWLAILRTGEYVIYREFCESNLSITQRVEKIIEHSNNKRVVKNWHASEELRRYKEEMTGEFYRRTFADSKIFRRDPTKMELQDDWTENYRRAGLNIERATNLPPRQRCDQTNDLFLPDHTRKHLLLKTDYAQRLKTVPETGFRLYLTNDCPLLRERLENYLFEQVKSGANAGDFTGEPGKNQDDLIDALCYGALCKLRWVDNHLLHQRLM